MDGTHTQRTYTQRDLHTERTHIRRDILRRNTHRERTYIILLVTVSAQDLFLDHCKLVQLAYFSHKPSLCLDSFILSTQRELNIDALLGMSSGVTTERYAEHVEMKCSLVGIFGVRHFTHPDSLGPLR